MNNISAIILSAGTGKRMNANVPKQYLEINDKPIIYYTIKAFEESAVDNIVLVTGKGDEEYVKNEIVDKYSFNKVIKIVAGGKERYNSVYNGLMALKECSTDYVLIHDGARAVVQQDMLARIIDEVKEYGTAVAGVPVKDTIKLVDSDGYVKGTPPRKELYIIQTPQAFEYLMIMNAYTELISREETNPVPNVTDDAMVVETLTNNKVRIVEGSYKNIKITTPEDMNIAKLFLEQ